MVGREHALGGLTGELGCRVSRSGRVVNDGLTKMIRAACLGLLIGLVIGLSACAAQTGGMGQGGAGTGFYGAVETGRSG